MKLSGKDWKYLSHILKTNLICENISNLTSKQISVLLEANDLSLLKHYFLFEQEDEAKEDTIAEREPGVKTTVAQVKSIGREFLKLTSNIPNARKSQQYKDEYNFYREYLAGRSKEASKPTLSGTVTRSRKLFNAGFDAAKAYFMSEYGGFAGGGSVISNAGVISGLCLTTLSSVSKWADFRILWRSAKLVFSDIIKTVRRYMNQFARVKDDKDAAQKLVRDSNTRFIRTFKIILKMANRGDKKERIEQRLKNLEARLSK